MPLAVQRINQFAGHIHIDAQDFRRAVVTAWIVRTDEILRRGETVPLSVREDFHQHGVPTPGSLALEICRTNEQEFVPKRRCMMQVSGWRGCVSGKRDRIQRVADRYERGIG